MAPEGAISLYSFSQIFQKLKWKKLGDPGWRILPFHKLDIPWVAELAWKLCNPAAGNTDKIDLL
jgi:hypothetical protein